MIKSQKCNAPPNWHMRWTKSQASVSKCKVNATKNFWAIFANLQLKWNNENSALLILLHEMLWQSTIVNNSKMSLLVFVYQIYDQNKIIKFYYNFLKQLHKDMFS